VGGVAAGNNTDESVDTGLFTREHREQRKRRETRETRETRKQRGHRE